ncbi:MAG: hypothetical protein IJR99_14960 [Kiritimatiellae bacterium]|nr:hypothetical protein [Kiritimatiellia bacterium]
MKSVKLMDTSILCELLEVPAKSSPDDARKIRAEFARLAKSGVRFILPIAAVIETGNHIAQNGDGNIRREKGNALARFVRQSLKDESPFLKPPFWNKDDLEAWTSRFPEAAMRKMGLGDVSILRDLEIAKTRLSLPSAVSVDIWSKDGHFTAALPPETL